MVSVLVTTYVLLARCEEREAAIEFGGESRRYAARMPMVLPRLWAKASHGG